MRVFRAVAVAALLVAGPAYAQSEAPVPKYGDEEKPKTESEKAAERAAERAYQRSLGNIPAGAAPTDPWGNVRSETPPKAAAKQPAKRTKQDNPTN